ncbi:MAG: hypothetical protein ING77_09745 [Rhodocyclaceae bacterium]|nr:hypothetical protein [Rhodocyclaceae bacterium]
MLTQLARMATGMLAIMVLAGCAVGGLSPRTHLALDAPVSVPANAKMIGNLSDSVPRPEIGKWCVGKVDPNPLFAIRPGVGTRLTLMTFSAGTFRSLSGSGSTYPPLLEPTRLALRLIKPNSRLDPEERAVLATFLAANRTQWSPDAAIDGYPVEAATRRALESVLEANQAILWNAFVRSLCVEVRDKAPVVASPIAPTIRAVADMAALCNVLTTEREAFVKTFIDTSKSKDDCAKRGQVRSLNGTGQSADGASWAAAALGVSPPGGDSEYYDSAAMRSPMAMLGAMTFNAVRPLQHDAPDWSLTAWEASGICSIGDEAAVIDAVLLRGASDYLRVVETGATHKIVNDIVARRLVRLPDTSPFEARIGRDDLQLLLASDVRALRWKAGETVISVPGCDRSGI